MTDRATYEYGGGARVRRARLLRRGSRRRARRRARRRGRRPRSCSSRPSVVHAAWDRSASVMPRRRAAEEWAGRCHAWAREHLPDDVDWPQLAALARAGRRPPRPLPARRSSPAGARSPSPTIRGARAAPAERAARAARRAARRGGAHRRPRCRSRRSSCARRRCSRCSAGPSRYPDPEPFHERWALAEARTDRMFGRTLAVLDDDERGELVELLGTLTS